MGHSIYGCPFYLYNDIKGGDKMGNLYAVELDKNNVSYVKSKDELYLHSTMGTLQNLQPYIRGKVGVYILTGSHRVYVGEGEVFKRLMRHKANKVWAEDVYVYLKDSMNKEDSLQYEGAFLRFLTTHSDYITDNKDGVRDNDIEVIQQIQKFQWLGLEVHTPKLTQVKNNNGEVMIEVTKTPINTYKVSAVFNTKLDFIQGYEFQSLKEVTTIIRTIGG